MTTWILFKVLSFWFTPKANESSTRKGNETRVHLVVVAVPLGLSCQFIERHPPECGGGGSQWGGMQVWQGGSREKLLRKPSEMMLQTL